MSFPVALPTPHAEVLFFDSAFSYDVERQALLLPSLCRKPT
jgi:hypothetical protein